MWGRFLTPQEERDEDMQFIHDWLNKQNGKIAYTNQGTFCGELNNSNTTRKWIITNRAMGKIKFIDPKLCANAEKEFRKQKVKSNDKHVLALARAGDIKILCTDDDALMGYFKNMIGGKIYQYKKHHKDMLSKDTCP
ncbi:MAG: hypothetical protein ACNYPH_03045 [Gammaproteobacteria bacterium WSBS_2016_MAG_OTU1]